MAQPGSPPSAPDAAPEHGAESVGARAGAGVAWLTVQTWVVRILSLVTIAILTRVLGPEDFGTVAAASTVLPFFFLLADLGFASYIVQVAKTDQRMLSTAFWFSAIAGVVLCGVLVAMSPAWAIAFSSAKVVPVMQVLSLTVVFTAAGSLPIALLRRAMRFRILAIQGAVAAALAQVTAIIMTLSGFGVWALVGQTLVSPAVSCVFAWVSARWRPSFTFSGSQFWKMCRYGGQVLGVEFVAMVRRSGEAAIVSSVLGIAALGYLNIAQRLIQITQDLTGGAVIPVSTVAFAKIRESKERLNAAYLRALRVTYAAMSPPLTLLAIAAPVIVPIVFGDGWAPSYQVAQVLALAATLTVAAALDHGLFYGLGQPGRWFWFALVVEAATIGMTALTASSGLVAIALGFLVVATTATVVRWFLVARLLGTSPAVVARPFGFLLVAIIVPGAAGWATLIASAQLPSLVRVLFAGMAVLVCHLVVVRVMARDVIDQLARLLRHYNWASRLPFRVTQNRGPDEES